MEKIRLTSTYKGIKVPSMLFDSTGIKKMAPFEKPIDEEKPLADICHYTTPYYTDRVSQRSQELGIDSKFKEHLSKYSSFLEA